MGRTSVAEPKIFSDQANEVLLEVRTAVGQVLAARGVSPQTVQRAYRRLQIDKKLAWRLGKVLQSEDPYAAARHMPGAAAMRAFFEHAEAEAVPPAVIDRAREAIERFEQFADTHAHTRRAFDLMLSAHAESHREETDVVHRKEATSSLSYIWGVVAEAQLKTCIARPDRAGLIDVATINGFVNLQWIRPNVGWIVKRSICHDDSGQVMDCPAPEPLDPAVRPGDVPLLKKYCSPVLPPMRRIKGGDGCFFLDELVQANVGTTSATTCLVGEMQRGWVPAYRDEHNRLGSYVATARTPCHALLLDIFLHRDTLIDASPTLLAFGDLEFQSETMPLEQRSRHRLMPWKKLENLGWGLPGAYTPHFARYVDMLADCFNHLGWNPSEFQLLRAAIEYPVIPSSIAVQYELPPRPA